MKTATEKLAICGGEPAVEEGLVQPWPPIDETDRKMILESLENRKLAFGPNCEAFQEEFAAWNDNRHAIFTNSGTAALHMGLVACGVGAGDHVLVTAYSWSSSATCILHHNAIPIFVDIDFDTVNMDLDKVEAAITPRTKAIVAVNLHGLALNMDKLLDLARKHNLKVVEDSCQSHGALFHGRKVGTFGDCAAFSFNQNKNLCTGEGGMFVTNDEELRGRAAQLWSFGEVRTPSEDRDYHAYALGWMYRANDITGAFGRAQLRKLDGYLEQQRENVAVLDEELKGIPGLILPIEPEGHKHTYYNYVLRIDNKTLGWNGKPDRLRNAVFKAIQAEGVKVSLWQRFILPRMTVFQAKNAYGGGVPWSLPGADEGVDYTPTNYPVAQRHCDTHFTLSMPIRSPNGPEVIRRLAGGIRKVMENLDQIDPEALDG